MEYAQYEGADWRSEIEEWIRASLRHSVFNPNKESAKFLRKHVRGDFRRLKTEDTDRFSKIVARIVDLDSREIARRSDYVVCYWDRSAQRGAGTKGEVTIARLYRKPVYMVTEVRPENIPGWILGCTTKMFGTFHELKQFLKNEFIPTRRISIRSEIKRRR
jgi:hypothetical protein